jgi:RNA polymerase sigma-70 factor (ECF subfamily)
MADATQETRWVLLAQAGDRAALDGLLRAVQEPLFRYLAGLVGNQTLAEDILQEVFLRLCRKLGTLREPELFRPWAYRVATREAFKHLQRERRWVEQVRDEAVLGAVPAPALADAAFVSELTNLVADVPPASRAVLLLHYGQGLTLSEAAVVLGVPPGTVKSRFAYGLAHLRRRLPAPAAADAKQESP